MTKIKSTWLAALFSLFFVIYTPFAEATPASDLGQSCANVQGKIDFSKCVNNGDMSQYYLGMIFGDMGNVLFGQSQGTSSDLMARLFNIFNIVILTLGSIIVMYTTIVSTINTAQEGEVMGKKWSSIWIPLRSVAGVSFLVPLGTGYSFLQILIMWIVMQGVGAANAIWGVVLDYVQSGQSINQPSTVSIAGLDAPIATMLQSMICLQTINNNPEYVGMLGDTVTYYKSGQSYLVGVQGNPKYAEICGSITIPENSSVSTDDPIQQTLVNGAMTSLNTIYGALYIAADEAVNIRPEQWSTQGSLTRATGKYESDISELAHELTPPKADVQAVFDSAKQEGWITAGSYYYKLIRASSVSSYLFITPPQSALPDGNQLWSSDVTGFYNQYLSYANGPSPRQSLSLGASSSAAAGFSGPFIKLAIKFINHLSSDDPDPMVSLQNFGSDLTITVEIIWMSAILAIFVALALSYIQAWGNPTGFALTVIVDLALPVINLILAFLWGAGVSLGIYLPLVPYLVFSFCAMSWMITVLEAVIAAPIVALGLTAPSQDHLGKASAGLVLIASVFLRPGLMIIGFIAASRIYIAVMKMIKFSMAGVIQSQISGIGLFGSIALIVLYGGLAISIAHKCFTLIYAVPDRVMRWIGGQQESSNAAQMEQQSRQASEKGGKISGELAKGAAAGAGKLNNKVQSRINTNMNTKNPGLTQGGAGGGSGETQADGTPIHSGKGAGFRNTLQNFKDAMNPEDVKKRQEDAKLKERINKQKAAAAAAKGKKK